MLRFFLSTSLCLGRCSISSSLSDSLFYLFSLSSFSGEANALSLRRSSLSIHSDNLCCLFLISRLSGKALSLCSISFLPPSNELGVYIIRATQHLELKLFKHFESLSLRLFLFFTY